MSFVPAPTTPSEDLACRLQTNNTVSNQKHAIGIGILPQRFIHVGKMTHANPTHRTMERRLVPTIFHEPWWLEIASNGSYREATVEADGMIVGRLPYVMVRKAAGPRVLTMPDMTHVLGPALGQEIVANTATRSLRPFSITGELISQLPKASHVWFQLHRGISNTLAFEAADFSTGVDFTTEIAPDTPQVLWRQMRDKTRNVIRRAQERLSVVDQIDPEQFLDFYETNLQERGRRNRYDRTICGELIGASASRNVGRLLVAIDPVGKFEAAIFTIWDHESEYYFMSSRSRTAMNGATSLLIWTAIQHAAAKGLTFNTDGMKSKTNMLLLTGFGGVLRSRMFVTKSTTLYQIAQSIGRRFTA